MDNRVFNVNGKTPELLLLALQAVFEQDNAKTCGGWRSSPKSGLILYAGKRDVPGFNAFLAPLKPSEVISSVQAWLRSDEAKLLEFEGWDADCDHDGHNTMGWRVFVEDWGHVEGEYGVICAVRPAYMWHGK